MKIGVISDTHGFLDPRVPKLFAGVDHILHAGDVGPHSLLLALEAIAPVTAVLGNTDTWLPLNLTETVDLGGRKFLVHHIVDPRALTDDLKHRLVSERPDAIVFGHTHKAFSETIGSVLFFNPGYAGKQRFALARSVAILDCDQRGIRPEFLEL
jgi:putative phosphoesterase